MGTLRIIQRDGIIIIRPEDIFAGINLTKEDFNELFKSELGRYVDAPKVIFNMINITELDIGGVEIITNMNILVNRLGGRIAFVNIEEHINALLIDGNLRFVFEWYDNEDAAVAGLRL